MILLTLGVPVVSAAGLAFDAAHPPALVSHAPDGMPNYRFSELSTWAVLPAAVVRATADGVPIDALSGGRAVEALGGPFWLVRARPNEDGVAVAAFLQLQPGVASVFPDVRWSPRPTSVAFNDPERGAQWYLDSLDADLLFERSLGDPSIRVAVIDSGIDIAGTDLVDKVVSPYDAHDQDDDPSPNEGEFCDGKSGICDIHGTAVSGIILAEANNDFGIVGLCPACSLVPIKMLGETTAMSEDIRAFEHAIEADAAVINNSWGYGEPIEVPTTLADAIERAATVPRGGLGAVVVFAAGNDDRELGPDELEALPDLLCVTATDTYHQPTNYTNYGDAVDLAAPSATVSIIPGDGITTTFGGTSAAAPVVSGVAAWVLSVHPELSAAEVRQLLVDTATLSPLIVPDENGHDPYFGFGELDLAKLVAALPVPVDTASADSAVTPSESARDHAGCGCSVGAATDAWDRPGGWVLGLCLLALTARRRTDG